MRISHIKYVITNAAVNTEIVAKQLISNFQILTDTHWQPSEQLVIELNKYLDQFSDEHLLPTNYTKNALIFIINDRLSLNRSIYRLFIDKLASQGIIFNYHQKLIIEENINRPEINFIEWYRNHFSHINVDIKLLDEIEQKRNREIIKLDYFLKGDKKYDLVIESIFCSYIYYCIKEYRVHENLNKHCKEKYLLKYWDHLQTFHASQIYRNEGLIVFDLDSLFDNKMKYDELLNQVINLIKNAYFSLANHCYIAVIIGDKFHYKSQLIADITIFSEKFLENKIERSYFRWKDVAKQTIEYINYIDISACKFEYGNEGFIYKDCYIVYKDDNEKCLIMLEKNERDENPIPCPKCRTLKVNGNSYPVLGVRSWECKNIFCGEKSKYNRGKRYSLASIIRQQAILDDRNIIEKEILKKWRRDIVIVSSFDEIYEFLINCYSLYGDTVVVYSQNLKIKQNMLGRYIKNYDAIDGNFTNEITVNDYYSMLFFRRFLINKKRFVVKSLENLSTVNNLKLYHGDAFQILCSLDSNSLGGGVTSPPYYNARDYSYWDNIYCYLYDMYNIAKELYRCLKPGSPFLLNIFDYFDNENIIVFSDMGKKRLILSSYMSFIFRYVGFNHVGNVAWDKGEIEGNRNFNQGNYSPYYQAPLNCWEHILIFAKGEPSFDVLQLPKLIKETAVIKMIKGKNVYGHTAPFPEAIANLLFSLVSDTETIIDPFSGSMTTGIAALKKSRNSVNIEIHKEYCDLALDLLQKYLDSSVQAS